MPKLRNKKSALSRGVSKKQSSGELTPTSPSKKSMARTSSLNSTELSQRASMHRTHAGDRLENDAEEGGVEMNLLRDGEQRQAARETDEWGESHQPGESKGPMSTKDKRAMALLCILYLIQGVPLGLALGSVPFLLKDHLSYSQLATFALSSYPYSLKLLWSPIVDSVYFVNIGRRKSWIVPMQLIVGTVMLYISFNVQRLMDDAASHVGELTFVFTSLVLISATQDIAVDGWALTLLSQENLSYASTCQTIGLNTGYFASFTVFLAFNSVEFTESWGVPHLTLSSYLKFWGVVCYAVTFGLLFLKKEDKEAHSEADMSITGVYKQIWAICKLKHIQSLIVMHFFAKLGFAASDAATSLKMIEKGFKREELAVAVLIDFPFQIAGGWLAAKWSRGDRPLRPWVYAFLPRLAFCLLGTLVVYWFPTTPISKTFFVFLIVQTVLSSFSSTVQFVGISAFHTRVSDPLIGGTYMTLLNTFTNLGGTWPKYFVLKGVDMFSAASCKIVKSGLEVATKVTECVSDEGKAMCQDIGGQCIVETDGYYIVSFVCMAFGVVFLFAYIIPTARKLQELPLSVWRIKLE